MNARIGGVVTEEGQPVLLDQVVLNNGIRLAIVVDGGLIAPEKIAHDPRRTELVVADGDLIAGENIIIHRRIGKGDIRHGSYNFV